MILVSDVSVTAIRSGYVYTPVCIVGDLGEIRPCEGRSEAEGWK